MKKLIYFLSAALCLAACRKESVEHFINASAESLEANKIGLSQNGTPIVFTVSSDIYWMSSFDADWLSISPVAGYGPETEVTVTMSPNSGQAREAELVFEAIDGTRSSIRLCQKGVTDVINYLTLGFDGSFATYSGVGSAPVQISGEGFSINDGILTFNEDNTIFVGPVQPHGQTTFQIAAETEGEGIKTFVNNKMKVDNQLDKDTFTFDQLTSFYVILSAPKGTKVKSLSVSEGNPSGAQEIFFGDGKPVGYVYFTDDLSWLADFTEVNVIKTKDATGEALWTTHTSKPGFNPTNWSLSDNQYKQRTYCHCNALKMGRAANSAGSGGGVITPAMDITANRFSNVAVKMRTCAFYTGSSFDAEAALLFRIIGDGEIRGSGATSQLVQLDMSSTKKAIWDSANWEYRVQNIWEEITIEVEGISSSTRFAFETNVETTKGRIFFGGATITKIAA